MGYFPGRYDSRVVIYEHKMLITLAKGFDLVCIYRSSNFVHLLLTMTNLSN